MRSKIFWGKALCIPHNNVKQVSCMLLLCITSGCTSIQTTFFRRLDDEQLCQENAKPIHGVPVMVKVPSHLELRIEETIHLIKEKDSLSIQTLEAHNQVLRSAQAEIRFTEKMFVLDPKRPISGTANYGLTFRSKPKANSNAARDSATESAGHGYLQGLKYKADDQTITNVSAFLANIAPLLASPISMAPNEEIAPVLGLYTTSRTVAYGLFDLSSASFEDEVNSFLELHLNQCQPCIENQSIHSTTRIQYQPEPKK